VCLNPVQLAFIPEYQKRILFDLSPYSGALCLCPLETARIPWVLRLKIQRGCTEAPLGSQKLRFAAGRCMVDIKATLTKFSSAKRGVGCYQDVLEGPWVPSQHLTFPEPSMVPSVLGNSIPNGHGVRRWLRRCRRVSLTATGNEMATKIEIYGSGDVP